MRINILTLGTRGDIQPYIALAQGLNACGHVTRICTSPSFERFVCEYGVDFYPIRADYSLLSKTEAGAKAMAGGKLAGMRILKNEVLPMMRRALSDMALSCKDAQAIIYHPKAIGSYDIAEAKEIPLIAAHPVPVLFPVEEFSNPAFGGGDRGALINKLSYSAMNHFGFTAFSSIVNEWRKNELGLARRSLSRGEGELKGRNVPALCGCSPHVLPNMKQYEDVCISGFWFLKEQHEYIPSGSFLDFLNAGVTPIYAGYGSMVGDRDIESITIEAVRQSGLRAFIASSALSARSAKTLPRNMYALDSVPHSFLFPLVSSVLCHGGAGTVAEALRAGKPTVIAAFFGDQPFWGKRLYEIGVAPEYLRAKKMSAEELALALRASVIDLKMRSCAADLGKKIRDEDGVSVAVEFINRCINA